MSIAARSEYRFEDSKVGKLSARSRLMPRNHFIGVRSAMQRISSRQIIHQFRSGMGDEKLMKKYGLSLKGYQRLLRTLVSEKVIERGELYDRSPVYKAMSDILSARHSPRVSVPLPIKVYDDETSQSGFVRDISENGFRVAGIEANVGEAKTLRIPLNELAQGRSLEFDAICRWSKTVGKTKRYVLSGFEIAML